MKSASKSKSLAWKALVALVIFAVSIGPFLKGDNAWGWFTAILAISIVSEVVYQQHRCYKKRTGYFLHSIILVLTAVVGCAVMYDLRTTRQGTQLIVVGAVMVIAFDTFSQLTGMIVGKLNPNGIVRISPHESPNKTVAGFMGGLIMSITAGGITFYNCSLITVNPVWMAVLMGYLPIIAYYGDINASMIKRRLFHHKYDRESIKDFSKLLGPHGGVSDRFDAMMAVFSTVGLAWVLLI